MTGETQDPDVLVSAIDQIPVIVMICEGPELRVAGLNAATRALIPDRPALGRPLGEVFHELDGQRFLAAYETVNRTGTAMTGQEWRAHIDLPDGSVHELYATFTITPWRWPDGRQRGVIGVGFDVTDMVRARLAAEEQAGALRRRYEETRDVVTALQQELLPAALPVLPGARIAASYLPADAGTAAGGDWFDAVPRPDGTVALVVGDVVGHGVTASGVMGRLRAILQDRLDDGEDPAAALTAADRMARRVPAAHAATVCVAVLDPATGALSYSTAGHPPPLVITAGGATRFLTGTGGRPLGTGGTPAVRTDRLDVGDLLLLYSDGILERPGLDLDASTAELARVAADSAAGRALRDPQAGPAERVCTQTVELLVRGTGHADDITLLAAQRVEPVPDLELVLPAEAGSLRRSRIVLGDWLTRLGTTDDDAFLLQHALGELTANAVEHAAGGTRIELRATLDRHGTIEATVTDHGRWREPARQSHRGRGLALTAQLVDSLHVEPSAGGTTVTVRHAPVRPARMLTGALSTPERRAPARPDFRLTDGGTGRIIVEGPVDAVTATRLQQELVRRGRGGALPVLVDLSGVSHLASAGVSALHRVAQTYADQGGTLTLYAAPGSPARRILALVGLPQAAVLQPDETG